MKYGFHTFMNHPQSYIGVDSFFYYTAQKDIEVSEETPEYFAVDFIADGQDHCNIKPNKFHYLSPELCLNIHLKCYFPLFNFKLFVVPQFKLFIFQYSFYFINLF